MSSDQTCCCKAPLKGPNLSEKVPARSKPKRLSVKEEIAVCYDAIHRGTALFPTYCLPMAKFLELERMQTHESLLTELIISGGKFTDGCGGSTGRMHFISHEWLGFRHPDPDGVQLRRMQSILATFADGKARESSLGRKNLNPT